MGATVTAAGRAALGLPRHAVFFPAAARCPMPVPPPVLTLEDALSPDVVTLSADATVGDARRAFAERRIGALPLVDAAGSLAGIFTTTDLARAGAADPATPLRRVMSRTLHAFPPEAEAGLVARFMWAHHVHHVVVTRGARLVGIVSALDLLRVLARPAAPAPAGAARERQRRRLEGLLGHLSRRTAAVDQDLARPGLADAQEAALEEENDEVLGALAREGRDQLAVVGEALARLDAGRAETCADCGGAIEPARLEALPYAVTCVTCARSREARR